jgi:hypothetical protein
MSLVFDICLYPDLSLLSEENRKNPAFLICVCVYVCVTVLLSAQCISFAINVKLRFEH